MHDAEKCDLGEYFNVWHELFHYTLRLQNTLFSVEMKKETIPLTYDSVANIVRL